MSLFLNVNERIESIFQVPGTLAQEIEQHLEKKIIEGQIAPGQRLIPEALASDFGVSKSPVREALSSLQKEGLVICKPRVGFFVAEIDLQDIENIYPIRASLNGLLVKTLIKEKPGPDFIAELEEVLNEMEAKCDLDDVRGYYYLNVKYYRLLLEKCRNWQLSKLIDQLGKRVLRFRFISMSQPGHLKRSCSNHRRLFTALKGHNAPAAVKIAEGIIYDALEVLRAFFQDRQKPLPGPILKEVEYE